MHARGAGFSEERHRTDLHVLSHSVCRRARRRPEHRTITVYRKVPDEYNEVEGIFPDEQYALVESSREQLEHNSNYIDIWKLKLEPNSGDYTRVTRWGEYRGFKASNPVVSRDGRKIAFQSARSRDAAGVGYGIFVMDVR